MTHEIEKKVKEWTGSDHPTIKDLIWTLAVDRDANDIFNREVAAARADYHLERLAVNKETER